ncbi:hypothetical protein JCM16303_000074 [Sporobolomyces ruberrimus]
MTRTSPPPSLLLLKTPSTPSPSPPSSSLLNVTHLSLLETSFNNEPIHSLSTLLPLLYSSSSGTGQEVFDGIVFCSKRSVKAFELAFSSSSKLVPSISPQRRRIPHFVVGNTTKLALLEVLERLWNDPGQEEEEGEREEPLILGEKSGTGQSLALEIIDYFKKEDRSTTSPNSVHEQRGKGRRKKRKLVFLNGDKTTQNLPDTLLNPTRQSNELNGIGQQELEFELEKIEVYSTDVLPVFEGKFIEYLSERRIPTSSTTTNSIREEERGEEGGGGNVWIGICSPSGGKQVLRILRRHSLLHPLIPSSSSSSSTATSPLSSIPSKGDFKSNPTRIRDNRLRFVAIGNTTRDYLEKEEGIQVDAVAEVPGEEGMVHAVLRAEGEENEEGRGI